MTSRGLGRVQPTWGGSGAWFPHVIGVVGEKPSQEETGADAGTGDGDGDAIVRLGRETGAGAGTARFPQERFASAEPVGADHEDISVPVIVGTGADTRCIVLVVIDPSGVRRGIVRER